MKNAHRWVVLYDIRDPKRLRKVARATEAFAVRVQYSVYEAFGGRSTILKLRAKILGLLDEEDSVAYIPICVQDWENSIRMGSANSHHEDPSNDSSVFL